MNYYRTSCFAMNQKGLAPILILIGILILSLVGGGAYYFIKVKPVQDIKSFEDCQKAGYPVLESYPAQCNTPNGKHFVQPLSEEEKKKLIPPAQSSSSAEVNEWKTYSNANLKYIFKYPPSWEVKDDSTIQTSVCDSIEMNQQCVFFIEDKIINTIEKKVQELSGGIPSHEVEQEKFIISKENGYKLSILPSSKEEILPVYIFIERNRKGFSIEYNEGNLIHSKILSTFKFTN